MTRLVFLDTGPLGLAARPKGRPDGERCRASIESLKAAGSKVLMPAFADY